MLGPINGDGAMEICEVVQSNKTIRIPVINVILSDRAERRAKKPKINLAPSWER